MKLTVAPSANSPFLWSITAPAGIDRGQLVAEVERQLAQLPNAADADLTDGQLWIEDAKDTDDSLVGELGFEPYRDLWQLRRPLPADPSGMITRSFDPERDIDSFIRVNGRAFAWHPEQGQLSAADVRETMATQDWFDADGFRLYESDGALAGFCWTKVHTNEDPPVGEIYAIAIDPDFHGRGLGGPMTLAGLEHLAGAGLTVANLYVESDNTPANRTYERLGFARYSTNRAYRITLAP